MLTHSANGRVRRLVLSAEEGIYANALDSAALVGAGPGRVLILSTSYGSRPLGPTHMCGAGTETVIRVILLRPDLRQTFSERVESCWTSIEAGRIVWNRSDQTLLLETFGGPGEGHSVKTYAVQDGGAVRLQPAGD